MPRADQPHTPEVELAARHAYAGGGGTSVILTPDLQAFCQSGISVIVAASSRGEAPVACIGCECRILPDGRMRLLLPRAGNEALLAIVRRGGRFAATFSQPLTHRSIQVKGSHATVGIMGEEDRQHAIRQTRGLCRELIEIGHSADFANAYCDLTNGELVAIDIVLTVAFVQTPGPGAGAELKA